MCGRLYWEWICSWAPPGGGLAWHTAKIILRGLLYLAISRQGIISKDLSISSYLLITHTHTLFLLFLYYLFLFLLFLYCLFSLAQSQMCFKSVSCYSKLAFILENLSVEEYMWIQRDTDSRYRINRYFSDETQDSHFQQHSLFSHPAPKYGCRRIKVENVFALSFPGILFASDMQSTLVSLQEQIRTQRKKKQRCKGSKGPVSMSSLFLWPPFSDPGFAHAR